MSAFLTPHTFTMCRPETILFVVGLIIGYSIQAKEISNRENGQRSNQLALGEQIKLMVAKDQMIRPEEVEPSINDRRFKVPSCTENFELSFPFSGKGTVKATCRSPAWEAYIRVRFSPQKVLTRGFVFTKRLDRGHILKESDIEMAVATHRYTGLVSNAKNIIGKSLTSSVQPSDFIRTDTLRPTVEVFLAIKEIHKGDFYSENNYKKVAVGIHMVTDQNRFKENLLTGSKARRNILPGAVISKNMVDSSYRAYAAKETIPRGDRITDQNVGIRLFWGSKAAGLITNKKEIRLSQATRTLRDGDVLRVSDIKPAILVKKGDNILLTIKKGPLQVVVAVEALANGKINDVIPMKNPESGGKLRGRITGTGRATGLR